MRDNQQVAGNPRRGKFASESRRKRRLKIQREQRASQGYVSHAFLVFNSVG